MNFDEAHRVIKEIITAGKGDSDSFAKCLRDERIPHISFSQITTVEFCPYRYFLQYIRLQDSDPLPDYFTKGRFLHQMIAENYSQKNNGKNFSSLSYIQKIHQQFRGDHFNHLVNAYRVHQQNIWRDCEIISVEHPFVMCIDGFLPPVVGVIDLILRKDGRYLLVDHKTGRNFYPDDELQVAIYEHYIRQEFGSESCCLFYDHYRWVNSLERIRKPAFQRVEVGTSTSRWPQHLARIKSAYSKISFIQSGVITDRSGECFRCPYKTTC